MNNKIFQILVFAAIAILYILHFATKTVNSSTSETIKEVVKKDTTFNEALVKSSDSLDLEIKEAPKALSFPLAYINIDTVNAKYQFVIDKTKQLEKERRRLVLATKKEENSFIEEGQRIEGLAQSGQLNQMEYTTKMQDFQKRSQEFVERSQKKEERFAKKYQMVMEQFNTNIKDFLKENKDKLKYSYVMGYGQGSNIFFANDSLDITNKLLDALNSSYKKGRK